MGRLPAGSTTKFSRKWRQVLYRSLYQTHLRLLNLSDYMTTEHRPDTDDSTYFDESVLITGPPLKRQRLCGTLNKLDMLFDHQLESGTEPDKQYRTRDKGGCDDTYAASTAQKTACKRLKSAHMNGAQGEAEDPSNNSVECNGDDCGAEYVIINKADVGVDSAIHDPDSCFSNPSDRVKDDKTCIPDMMLDTDTDTGDLDTVLGDGDEVLAPAEISSGSTTASEGGLDGSAHKAQDSENILCTPWKQTFAAQLEEYLVLLSSCEETTFYDTIERGFKGRLGPFHHIIMSKLNEDIGATTRALSFMDFVMRDSCQKSSLRYFVRKYGETAAMPQSRISRKSPLMNVMAVNGEQAKPRYVRFKSPREGRSTKTFLIREKSSPPQSPCKSSQRV